MLIYIQYNCNKIHQIRKANRKQYYKFQLSYLITLYWVQMIMEATIGGHKGTTVLIFPPNCSSDYTLEQTFVRI